MERKAELPGKPAQPPPPSSLARPIAAASAINATAGNLTSSSSSSSSLSPPDFLRHVHAVFKRHRPLGTMQSNFSRASHVLVSHSDRSKGSTAISSIISDNAGKKLAQAVVPVGDDKLHNPLLDRRKDVGVEVRPTNPPEDSSLTPPSLTGTTTTVHDEHMNPFDLQKGGAIHQMKATDLILSSHMESQLGSAGDALRRDQFSLAGNSPAFQKAEGSLSNLAANNQDPIHQDALSMETFGARAMLLEKMHEPRENQHYVHPVTRCSVAGSSCATTLSVHSCPTFQSTRAPLAGQTAFPTQMSDTAAEPSLPNPDLSHPDVQGNVEKDAARIQDQNQHQGVHLGESDKGVPGSASCLQPQVPSTNNLSSNVDMGSSQPSKAEKVSRKKKYDPDVFVKVNGKLYQKLGKIGSGGSSEVHKVISSDCTIYALKKIKLKGRDYPTAYGFCQEIEYLNKLKGRSNIIQLIDYEVTYRTLLCEVVNGSMANKDGRIKDDEYIYMVLEYGEIDLAHMLSQKWKEMDDTTCTLDENWLRFYWQQMLEAVNTIHEERIVHSDLKPANFLLVRGSLKLIDFGIAKAIMSDTTNIQRDAQVGTLNYMSPEAFMWNEPDANGNTIKCGRPSDIWSLGCILYQMVYGKTPFSEYKTFWAKFKVITDRNHEIVYEPVSNPLLIDLMRRCLAWDRNERWRIPQLLQHPFLVPPMPRELPSQNQSCKLLMQRVEMNWSNPEVSRLCSELHEVITRLEQEQVNLGMHP